MELTSTDLARLRLLSDQDEIRACLTRYARGLDRHDVELIASAFHEDAFVHDPAFRSVGAFAAWANAHHLHRWTTHQHFQTNDTIVLTGDDVAHCETYCLLLGRREGGDVDVIAARYIDRVERRAGRWAIAERAVVLESTGILDGGGAGQQAMLELYEKGSRDRDDLSYRWMS
jgi:ketosteroid isomerase-like protein